MAGHSKFANIKHRKGAQDAKRAKLFTKLQREITVGYSPSWIDILTANLDDDNCAEIFVVMVGL